MSSEVYILTVALDRQRQAWLRGARQIARLGRTIDCFWSKRETGAQDLNVELERNVSKNVGHDVEVKLVPKDESNGTGRGVVTTVTEGTDVEVLVVCDCTVEVDSVVDEVVVS